MSQYLLSVHHDYSVTADEERMSRLHAQVDALNAEIQAAGAWVFGGGLHEPGSATVARMVDGELALTDGPFAETKEVLGGFWIITAADLDGALAWAGKATAACEAPVEVRPFQDEPEQ